MNEEGDDDALDDVEVGEVYEIALTALTMIRDEAVLQLDQGEAASHPAIGTLKRLFSYQGDRGIAVNFLLSRGFAWDAEIVLRSYYEVSARILFIALAEEDEREGLLEEYWEVLGDIGDRKRAGKASESEAIFKADSPRDAAVMGFLRDPAHFSVEPKANKTTRKAIEQKWSFAEIVAALAKKESVKVGGLPEMKMLLHPYGTASHLIHADAFAMELMRDRATRSPEELLLLEETHACRIITDLVSLSYNAADAVRRMLRGRFADPNNLHETIVACLNLARAVRTRFYDTQAPLYQRNGFSDF